ncbi:restriction endonuclease [Thermodesulfobacteriota bacterium]
MLESKTLYGLEYQVAEAYKLSGALKITQNKILSGVQIDFYIQETSLDGSTINTIVECKDYKKRLSEIHVWGFEYKFEKLRQLNKAHKAVLVSRSGFTTQARKSAKYFQDLKLYTLDQLRNKLNKNRTIEREDIQKTIIEKTNKKYAFILMPFHESFDDIYWFGIRGAVEDAGLYCERADEIQYTGGVIEKIVNQIKKADVVIAEMSDMNPNVFYEVGIAHTMGKKVALVVKNIKDIPFDLRNQNHIVYNGKIKVLRSNLTELLKEVIH